MFLSLLLALQSGLDVLVGNARSNLTARVVLPGAEADPDTDEEPAEEAFIEEEGDFLEDFPDETQVGTSRPCGAGRWYGDTDHAQDLELVHVRIGSLAGLRLARFADHLKRLCLRQNFISHLDPEVFHQLTKLEELDMYDNKLKTVGHALDKATRLV